MLSLVYRLWTGRKSVLSTTLWEDLSESVLLTGALGGLAGLSSLGSGGGAGGYRGWPSIHPRTGWGGKDPRVLLSWVLIPRAQSWLRPCRGSGRALGFFLALARLRLCSITCVGRDASWKRFLRRLNPAVRGLPPVTGVTLSERHMKFWQSRWDTSLSRACQTVLWPYQWMKGIKTSS